MTNLISDACHFTRQQIFHHQKDRLPRSSVSVGTDPLATRASVANGSLLATVTAKIQGNFKAVLHFDCNEVPSALTCDGIQLTTQEFLHIIHAISNKSRVDRQLSWLFTCKPKFLLTCVSLVWIVAFVLVIVLLLDAPTSKALPIRLPVFVFPFVIIFLAYCLRWKRRKKYAVLAMQMFNKCVELNQSLFDEGKTLILTSARTETDVFHIYFMFYNISDCLKEVDDYLQSTPHAGGRKMSNIINFSTGAVDVTLSKSLAVRLCLILSAPYSQRLLFGLNPRQGQNAHVIGRNQCLCQFVQEFLSDYVAKVDTSQSLSVPSDTFSNYVNLSLRKNSMKTVQELITTPSDPIGYPT